MRQRRGYWLNDIKECEEIAGFGDASITRDLNGRFQIRGGTAEERKQAHDWMLRFLWPSDQAKPSQWPGITV